MVAVTYEAVRPSSGGDEPVAPDPGRDSELADSRFVFSPLRQRLTYAAIPAAYLIGVIGTFLAAHYGLIHPAQPASTISAPVAALVTAVFAVPALRPLKRFASVKLTIDDAEITIDNPLKTLRIAWRDITSLRW